jgi:methyl-accepting chemotaxis protein
VTQQNAALVEEAAAAAQSLQEQASGLSQVVSVFRLDREPQHQQLSQAASVRHPAPGYQRAAIKQPPPAKRAIAGPQRSQAAKPGREPLPSRRLAVAVGAGEWEEF